MVFRADVVAYDRTGQPVLVAEVKHERNASSERVAQIRQQLATYSRIVNARYWLLAFPDRFYLWVGEHVEQDEPDYVVDPLPFLNPFWGMSGIPQYLSETSFEMVVEGWLATLTWADDTDELPASAAASGNWLIKSGLFDALKNGHLAYEVTV